ncbi:MASE1 domain-containing protein [Actinopolymorpha cephalotaxi]|uniref:Integral membrane sensor domain MASE1 n=2 Tax=Actinopolymorpha cephalotaxi TaxID=504797 RepID=A0ABX2S397_9ACTN|nr:MASE1 domain-containing protein [Actinopolymorpha cephalotaxi]NYH84095.1 integral membrane sensor domain MASE1 [Actinopolymorpha cephalotaxi]
MLHGSITRNRVVAGLQILAIAAIYSAATHVVPSQVVGGWRVSMLWAPTGVGLAALLALGPRVWPGIVIGSFVINTSLGRPPTASVTLAAATALGLLCAYMLLHRVGFRVEMDQPRDVLALVFLGAFVGATIIASTSVATFVLSGLETTHNFGTTWFLWWLSYMMGVLVVTPSLLVIVRARRPHSVDRRRIIEGAALTVVIIVVMLVVIHSSTDLLFLAIPCVVWAAVRFRVAGAALSVMVVSAMTIFAALQRLGPFAHEPLAANVVTVETLIGTTALTAFILAATTMQRDAAHEQIRYAAGVLYEAVRTIDQRLRPRTDPATSRGGRTHARADDGS